MTGQQETDYWDKLMKASAGSLVDPAIQQNIRNIATDTHAPKMVRIAASGMLRHPPEATASA